MSQGAWQSRAGRPPPQAPDDTIPDDTIPDGLTAEPDYELPSDPFGPDPGAGRDRGGPDRPAGRAPRWAADSRRLSAVIAAIALAAALVGGLLGGYVVNRAQDVGASPGYSLGPAPRTVPERLAGSVSAVAARVLPSVVMIRVNGPAGTGSGFVIRGGYIVTDNHVVTLDGTARTARIQVVLASGATMAARLVGRDTYSDIAVIKPVGQVSIRPLPLGNSASLAVGDPVIAFGAPLGLAGTVTSGIISALNRPVQPGAGNGPAAPQVFLDAIQTDAPINPGNSGGPLVDRQGQVIGVNAAFDTLGGNMITGEGGSIGLGFAIPVNEMRRVATQIIRSGHATHAVLGALLNLQFTGPGAQIAVTRAAGSGPTVTPGGPAALAGLRGGDVIVSFAGQPVTSAQTLLDAIRAQSPGSAVPVTYLQGGQAREVTLRLGDSG